jgi:hypothetical protein
MDLKIWIQAQTTNAITGAAGWSNVKSNHRRTPNLNIGQSSSSKLTLSMTISPALQGQLVRQKFSIRWKHDRVGPDPVIYGYDGYTDSCRLPTEDGALLPAPAPAAPNSSSP